MDVKSLMIGDWVMIKQYPMRFEPKRFTEGHWIRSYCEFEPIELTEDILKANEFTLKDLAIGLTWALHIEDGTNDKCVTHILVILTEHSLFIRTNNHVVNIKLSYIHELQHALRLCGLNELADNFKLK